MVGPGTSANQRSQRTKFFASVDSTGSWTGSKQFITCCNSLVVGERLRSYLSETSNDDTKPFSSTFLAAAELGLVTPNSCSLTCLRLCEGPSPIAVKSPPLRDVKVPLVL